MDALIPTLKGYSVLASDPMAELGDDVRGYLPCDYAFICAMAWICCCQVI